MASKVSNFVIWPDSNLSPYIVFNLRSPDANGAMQKLLVRQAIEHGVDKSAVVKAIGGPDVAEVHGLKSAGTELPGIRVGSWHDGGRVTFAVCHGHNPGVVIDLADSKYDRVVMTIENPEEIMTRLSAPAG